MSSAVLANLKITTGKFTKVSPQWHNEAMGLACATYHIGQNSNNLLCIQMSSVIV